VPKIAELLADERCSQAVLVFLATTDVGRTPGPPAAGDGDGEASEASESEGRECEERLAFLRRKRKGLGPGVRLLSIACYFLWSFICLSFVLHLLAVSEREASS